MIIHYIKPHRLQSNKINCDCNNTFLLIFPEFRQCSWQVFRKEIEKMYGISPIKVNLQV